MVGTPELATEPLPLCGMDVGLLLPSAATSAWRPLGMCCLKW
jgi:hypothetical protein